MPSASVVRFQPNIPEVLTLKQAAGREVTGQYGEEFFHSLADGRQVYLKPVVEEKIRELGVQDGETVTIMRQVDGKSSKWIVRRPEVEAPSAAASPKAVNDEPSQAQPKDTGAARMVAGALIAAIDALAMAKEYAEKKGIPASFEVDYNAEDVRAIASTLIIQHYKQLENNLRYGGAQNGGNAWRQ